MIEFNRTFFIRNLIGYTLSILFVILLVYRIDVNSALNTLRSVNIYYLGLVLLVVLIATILRAFRWQIILAKNFKITFLRSLEGIVIGYFSNLILPFRGGEIVRAHYIGVTTKNSTPPIISTVVIERIFDGLSVGTIFIISLLLVGIQGQDYFEKVVTFVILLFSVVFFMLFVVQKRSPILKGRLIQKIESKLKLGEHRFFCYLRDFLVGFNSISSFPFAFQLFLISSLIWLITSTGIIFSAMAFGHAVGYVESLVVLGILVFALSIPSTPGFIGTFHAGMTYGLILFKIPYEVALNSSILFHVITFIPVILWGPLLIYRYGIKLKGHVSSLNN